MTRPGWQEEHELLAAGATRVAGCDEAGRGPLAGPVVAAAVILPVDWTPSGLNDSKLVSPSQRERLYEAIIEGALAWSVSRAEPAEIDLLNILRASLLAMRRAVHGLRLVAGAVLVDGNQRIPGLNCPQRTLIKGDSLSVSVAAASILAKVTRDRLMVELDERHPGYGFAAHKGYPCASHLRALAELGPCPAHRTSYGPVRRLLAEPPPLPPALSRGALPSQLSLFDEEPHA